MESWGRILDTFRGFDAVSGPLAYPDALSLLRDTCSRAISHPQTVDAGVQVLGPLEAAGLSFDHLWVIGVQASVWPAAARPNPFLPIRLQVRHGMPRATAEHEWEFARDRMAQYLRSCSAVHASYSAFVDGVADRASALLQEFAPGRIFYFKNFRFVGVGHGISSNSNFLEVSSSFKAALIYL